MVRSIDDMVSELPSELRKEVMDFVEFLIEKRARKQGRKLRQDWAGALREHREQYSALDLKKKALKWRGDIPNQSIRLNRKTHDR